MTIRESLGPKVPVIFIGGSRDGLEQMVYSSLCREYRRLCIPWGNFPSQAVYRRGQEVGGVIQYHHVQDFFYD